MFILLAVHRAVYKLRTFTTNLKFSDTDKTYKRLVFVFSRLLVVSRGPLDVCLVEEVHVNLRFLKQKNIGDFVKLPLRTQWTLQKQHFKLALTYIELQN